MKYSHYQIKYIGKEVGLRTCQHPGINKKIIMKGSLCEAKVDVSATLCLASRN
jgi:hypothetical protein